MATVSSAGVRSDRHDVGFGVQLGEEMREVVRIGRQQCDGDVARQSGSRDRDRGVNDVGGGGLAAQESGCLSVVSVERNFLAVVQCPRYPRMSRE